MNMSTAQEFKCLNSDHYNTPHAVWKQRFCCSVAKLSDCRTPGSCPPICPGVCFYSRPLIQWHYLTISSSAALFLLFVFPSIRVFSNESALCIRWPKYWSFSSSVNPSNKYSGLISFRIDWFDLLPVQGTLKSSPAPQFRNINSSVLSLLCGPTLTCVYDHWKNHSFD